MSKILKCAGQEIECNSCIKGTDYIYPLDIQGNQIAQFEGISDFSGYSLEDENGNSVNFDIPEPTENKILAQSISQLSISNAQKDVQIQSLVQIVADLNTTVAQLKTSIEGGTTNV